MTEPARRARPARRGGRVRGASLPEYSLLLVAILLVAAGAYKALGRRVDNGANQAIAALSDGGSAGGGALAAGGAGGNGGGFGQMVSDFVRGVVLGDFAEGSNGATIAGQIVGGLIPGVGQLADIRDAGAAVVGIVNGREGAWTDLGLAAVGFIPGVGDAAKGVLKNADEIGAVARNADEIAAAARRTDDVAGAARHADEAAAGAAGATRRTGGEILGEGGFSVARREGDHVVKEIKDEVLAVGGGTVALDQAGKARLAERMAEFTNDVSDGVGGNVVPKVEVVSDGVLKQPYVEGATLDELKRTNFEAYENAVQQKNAAMNKAAKSLGFDNPWESGRLPDGWEVHVDDNPANFRFDKNGNLTSWFDPIAVFPKPGTPGTLPKP